MEPAVLVRELEATKRRVEIGIAAMSAAGIDTTEVQAILQALEGGQDLHLSEMQRMLNALDTMPMAGMVA